MIGFASASVLPSPYPAKRDTILHLKGLRAFAELGHSHSVQLPLVDLARRFRSEYLDLDGNLFFDRNGRLPEPGEQTKEDAKNYDGIVSATFELILLASKAAHLCEQKAKVASDLTLKTSLLGMTSTLVQVGAHLQDFYSYMETRPPTVTHSEIMRDGSQIFDRWLPFLEEKVAQAYEVLSSLD